MPRRIQSEVRGAGLLGQHAAAEYRALVANQPLILVREPTNRADSNAVMVETMMLQPCGYIAKEDARVIAPQMDAGVLWLCEVIRPARPRFWAKCILWRADNPERFKSQALAHGANERIVDLVLQKKFIKGYAA